MTILTSANGSLPLTLRKGETLVIRNYSGTETVTGSTAAREDVSSTAGAGAVAYGPQSSAATLTISSSGSLDYSVVAGDMSPAVNALVSVPTGQIVTPSGEVVGGIPGLINWKYSNTRQVAAAYLGAQAGDLRSRIVVGQDSAGAGTGSKNNGTVDARSRSWPRQLAALLGARGITAYDTWACGQGLVPSSLANYVAYDPRVAFGSAASLNTTWNGMAGSSWRLDADTTNGYVELTPQIAFDTLDIIYGVSPGTGVFRLLDQASTQAGANISTVNGTNGAVGATVTFPAGSTKARAVYVSTNLCLIGGMGVRNSSANGIEIVNTSISGAETAFFAATDGNSWMAHRASLPVLFGSATAGRNVYVLGGGYNDIYIGGQTLETVKTRMRARIDHLRTLSNVPDIIVLGYARLGVQSDAAHIAINDALRSVAVGEYDLPFVDVRSITEPVADAVTKGFMSADNLHMRAAYQGLVAATIRDGLVYASSLSS